MSSCFHGTPPSPQSTPPVRRRPVPATDLGRYTPPSSAVDASHRPTNEDRKADVVDVYEWRAYRGSGRVSSATETLRFFSKDWSSELLRRSSHQKMEINPYVFRGEGHVLLVGSPLGVTTPRAGLPCLLPTSRSVASPSPRGRRGLRSGRRTPTTLERVTRVSTSKHGPGGVEESPGGVEVWDGSHRSVSVPRGTSSRPFPVLRAVLKVTPVGGRSGADRHTRDFPRNPVPGPRPIVSHFLSV